MVCLAVVSVSAELSGVDGVVVVVGIGVEVVVAVVDTWFPRVVVVAVAVVGVGTNLRSFLCCKPPAGKSFERSCKNFRYGCRILWLSSLLKGLLNADPVMTSTSKNARINNWDTTELRYL